MAAACWLSGSASTSQSSIGTITSAGPSPVTASLYARAIEPGTSCGRTGWSTHTGYSPASPSSLPARNGSCARWRRSCWPTTIDERRPVHPRGRDRTDRVPEPCSRVQDRERRLATRERPAGRDTDDGALVEREDEAEIVGEIGQQRDLGRAGVGEDRRQTALTPDVEGRLANGLQCHERSLSRCSAVKRLTREPGSTAAIERLDLGPLQARHVALDVVADPRLQVREVAVPHREPCEQVASRARASPPGRPDPSGPSRRSAGAARAPNGPHAVRGSRRSARCRRRRPRPRRPSARWEIVIFVCETARSPATSTDCPPRKWRMLDALRPPRLAHRDELVRRPLRPGRHHPAVVEPDACGNAPSRRHRARPPSSRRARGSRVDPPHRAGLNALLSRSRPRACR